MDPLRTDLLAAAHSLLRLAIRIDARVAQAGPLNAHLVRVRDLVPGSPWLDTMSPDTAISGARARTVEVAERLLALARGSEAIDARHAAMLMHVVAGDALSFSSRVKQFADRHGVALPEWVREEPRAHQAAHELMRAVNRIAGQWPDGEKESGA